MDRASMSSCSTTYTDQWYPTVTTPNILSPSILHSHPTSPSYPYTPTSLQRSSPPVGPRPEGFSNANSVFATDDLCDLSSTDEEEDDEEDKDVEGSSLSEDFELSQQEERTSEEDSSAPTSSSEYFDYPMEYSSDEGDDEDSDDDDQSIETEDERQDQQSDTSHQDLSTPPVVVSTGTRVLDAGRAQGTPNIEIDVAGVNEDEEAMARLSDDSSDEDDDDDYTEAVITMKKGLGKGKNAKQSSAGGRGKISAKKPGLVVINRNMIRPPQARYNNTLPITFVLGLPPARPKGREFRAIPGHMTSYEFSLLIYAFINQMAEQKRFKTIINLNLAIYIRKCLTEGTDESLAGGNFKYWARKMFTIEVDPAGNKGDGMEGRYLVHEHRRVALVEEFYGLLTRAHERTKHGGRDKVMKEIRETYSYLPKDLVCRFTSTCPTCHPAKSRDFFNQQMLDASLDRRTEADFAPASATPASATPTMKRRRSLEDTEDEDEGIATVNKYQAQQQRKPDAHKNRQRKARQRSLTIQVPSAPIIRRDSDSTDSTFSFPSTPMDSFHEDTVQCNLISPTSGDLDSNSAIPSAFVTPNVSPLLAKPEGLPRYRRPHMRVTRSSSKITFAIDPLLDFPIEKQPSTGFNSTELDRVLKELLEGRDQYNDKQSRQLGQEEIDHIFAISACSASEQRATFHGQQLGDHYWQQKSVLAGSAVLFGSRPQAMGMPATNLCHGTNNRLGLSVSYSPVSQQPGPIEVLDCHDNANVTWNKLVLIPPKAISSCTEAARAFWIAVGSSELVQHFDLPVNPEDNPSNHRLGMIPFGDLATSCYLYHPKTSTDTRPVQERSISDIKVTLNDLHLSTDDAKVDFGSFVY